MNNLVNGRSTWMLLAGFAALALILVGLLAACGGDAVPGEDAATATPATEATERVRAPAPGSPATDREILIALCNALDGPNWENSENWLSDAPLGEWEDVNTDENGRVDRLQIGGGGKELKGEIPPEVGGLGALRDLSLSGAARRADGVLTEDTLHGAIPPELANLSNLETLGIHYSEVSQIPPELANLSNLISLSITFSELSGEIPPWLGDLSGLEDLWLSYTRLSGEIPPELGKLTRLRDLNLGQNQLTGGIPQEIADIPHLSTLSLGDNQLSGEIPPWLGNLSNLGSLDLRGNQLSGEIPSEVWNMFEREVEIEIYGNDFPCLTGGLRHLYIEQRANC